MGRCGGHKSVHRCNSTLDRISNLPTSIIENILMCLPLRDAARTSILSKKWRYKWLYIPKLVFGSAFNQISSSNLWFVIYQVLLFHRGPLLEVTLSIPQLESCPEIDQLIYFLSGKNIQRFTLNVWGKNCHKLPLSLFSCSQLRHLSLSFCICKPPPTFLGFSGLISLVFQGVEIVADFFQKFISKCPLLEELTLVNCTNTEDLEICALNLKYFYFHGVFRSISFQNTPLLASASIYSSKGHVRFEELQTSHIIKVFGGLPVIENLRLGYLLLKYLVVGNIPERLPNTLNHLKSLDLHNICLDNKKAVSSALCLIRSSPNLQKLKIVVFPSNVIPGPIYQLLKAQDLSDGSLNRQLLKAEDLSDASLNRLQEVRIESFNGTIPELEFVKFILTNSYLLETMHIQTSEDMVTDDRFKILRKITRFPRASTKAEILYYNRDEDLDRVYC